MGITLIGILPITNPIKLRVSLTRNVQTSVRSINHVQGIAARLCFDSTDGKTVLLKLTQVVLSAFPRSQRGNDKILYHSEAHFFDSWGFQEVEISMDKRQIRMIFLFQSKLGRSATETDRDINDDLDLGTMNQRTAQWWFEKFRTGDESLEDDERSGALVEENLRTTLKDIGSRLSVSSRTKKLDKWVPHELTQHQKDRRYELASALLLRNRNNPFLDRIMTCDEKGILHDNRVSIVMVVISIDEVSFKPRYMHLKFEAQNRKNFLHDLIKKEKPVKAFLFYARISRIEGMRAGQSQY
ncbi:unnamed protein product [Haemonchus placei]|uniref:HTH_48 domain-containing protein n=1 Tax=Haemonchus placei TaxID=6290 RepID=A0A0N4W6J5_HAEPC|nr:unnamed protein product [Haemonchus placei]